MKTAEILDKAADVIETRGWFRGHYKDPFGCGVCVVGAISLAAGKPADAYGIGAVSQELHGAVAAFEGWLEAGMDVTDWNDEVAESAEQVTVALREAAKAAGGAS